MRTERLDNGLTVILKPVQNKVVTIDAWVNTGSANENDALNGVSHFLEHMMFKGTPKYGVGDLDKAIMSVGGVWNAGTSMDFTHYYVTVASPFFDTALDAISDMIQNALIDAGEFDREKQVILEEYRRKQDDPWGMLMDELYCAVFERGPYRRTVLGSFESISALERDGMFDYYERYYTPDNMVLMVVGEMEPDEVLPKVRDAFGGFTRAHRPLGLGETESSYRHGAVRMFRKDVKEAYAALAFPGPPIVRGDEVLAVDLAATILGDGRSSRLYRTVKEEKGLVDAISAGCPTHRHDSVFYVAASLERAKLDDARAEIVLVLRELAQNGPTPAELAKAKRIIRNDFCYMTETNTGQSGTIGYYYTLTGSTEFCERYLDRVDRLDAGDVAAAAGRCFATEPVVAVVEPNDETRKGEDNHA